MCILVEIKAKNRNFFFKNQNIFFEIQFLFLIRIFFRMFLKFHVQIRALQLGINKNKEVILHVRLENQKNNFTTI